MLCLWDTRNLAKPVFVNEQSQSCIMSCDWLPDQKAVVSSTLEGVINVCDIQSQQMTLGFDTVAEMSADGERDVQSNICYRVKGLKNHPGGGNKFAVGAEMKFINVCDYDGARSEEVRLQTYGKFVGHRHSVRAIEVSEDYKYMLSASADACIYLWLNGDFSASHILAGHTDLCVSLPTLKAALNSVVSLERCCLPQQQHNRQ